MEEYRYEVQAVLWKRNNERLLGIGIDPVYMCDQGLQKIEDFFYCMEKLDSYEQLGLSGSFFENQNFPSTAGTVKMNHCLTLPLLRGSRNPPDIPYGTPLLLLMPTNKIEEGYLIYI